MGTLSESKTEIVGVGGGQIWTLLFHLVANFELKIYAMIASALKIWVILSKHKLISVTVLEEHSATAIGYK